MSKAKKIVYFDEKIEKCIFTTLVVRRITLNIKNTNINRKIDRYDDIILKL